jgi:uridine kinase
MRKTLARPHGTLFALVLFAILESVATLDATPPHESPLHRTIVIGIAGCSGSGKTTLARELASQLDGTLFPLDLYYRDLAHLAPQDRHAQDFDRPESLESELFIEHIRSLAAGEPIHRPVYDFAVHTRVPDQFELVQPARYLIVEGILALHFAELPALYDLSIYVDAPHDVCLARRIYRDTRERGRTEASVREQFAATVLPMAERYVLPSKAHAHLTVSGLEDLDWSVEQAMGLLRQRALLA